MTRSLVVLPDDSARPIVDAIHAAKRSLRVKMFVLSDPSVLNALVAAHHRKVRVQVILNGARRSGQKDNERAQSVKHVNLQMTCKRLNVNLAQVKRPLPKQT